MLKDGLYELYYRAEATPDAGFDSLLLALRGGIILGSDRWGAVFFGNCDFDGASGQYQVRVALQVPDGGTLVTEDSPRDGGVIDIEAALDTDGGLVTDLIDIAGRPVRIALKFKGPVPG